jgi:hypothetical protein
MKPLRVLITNIAMWSRSGTETHTRDLALGLLNCGQVPAVYSPRLGKIAQELAAAGVEVVDDLKKLAMTPDIIHGHHNVQTMTALLHFSDTPGIFVCHDRVAWHDAPPRFAAIRRYVAVDYFCRERLVEEHAIPENLVRVIGNAVDLERFRQRGPLPERPRRALLFSNYANKHTHLNVVMEACQAAGIALDVRGAGVKNVCHDPENILHEYDLVFAKARCAMEAMAAGAAVILCGSEGAGPLVTVGEFEALRRYNFGRNVLKNKVTTDILLQQIQRYRAEEAQSVSFMAREKLSVEGMIAEWLALYREVLDEAPGGTRSRAEDLRATAEFLLLVDPVLFGLGRRDAKIQKLEGELKEMKAKLASIPEPAREGNQP